MNNQEEKILGTVIRLYRDSYATLSDKGHYEERMIQHQGGTSADHDREATEDVWVGDPDIEKRQQAKEKLREILETSTSDLEKYAARIALTTGCIDGCSLSCYTAQQIEQRFLISKK
jgi:hypothetical protein